MSARPLWGKFMTGRESNVPIFSDGEKDNNSLQENNRIAIYLPSLRGGGAERVMLTLASSMANRGFVVDLILASAEGPYCKEVSTKVRVVDLRSRRVLTSLPGLVGYMRRERPVALLATMGHANVIALLARLISGVPMRLVVRAANVLGHGQCFKSLVSRALTHLLYPRAEAVIAVSQKVAQDLSLAVNGLAGKLKVIYNPVINDDIFLRADCPVSHPWFRQKIIPIIVAAGRLVPQKDFSTLLHAFSKVVSEKSCYLVILGEGPERPRLEALAHELGLTDSVDLPGFVDNPFSFMARAELFVLSSAWEGLPNTLIQALALGTPVVATDCPTGPREILEDGCLGELVPIGDPTAMAQAILRCLGQNKRVRCPEPWVEKFSVRTITDAYLKILLGY